MREFWWREDERISEDMWPVYEDFRNFLYLVWQHLGLPEPTPAQYEIAHFLQHGQGEVPPTGRTDIVMAFRGIGKSYISSAFVLWRLLRDPQNEKILVISASGTRAKEFVSQVYNIMLTMELLAHLRPRREQRSKTDSFDVNGATISQQPSLKAVGITGQITGNRATLIIADDVEIVDNSKTEEARMSLMRSINEFDAIKVPAQYDEHRELIRRGGDTLYLGTPQTEESIYNKLIKERGFTCFCLPARYPRKDKRPSYVMTRDDGTHIDILAPFLQERYDSGELTSWAPTDPHRFDEEDLVSREAKGRAWFALQFMLDTSLSDAERYPLKQHDLIVMSVNDKKAPMTVQWGKDHSSDNSIKDISNQGFTGDYMMRPFYVDKEWREFETGVLFVDPSGRGKDETAWSIVKVLNGLMYCIRCSGFNGDVQEAQMRIAKDARDYGVNYIEIEPNFAPGVWIAGFTPVLRKVWPNASCTVKESEWAKGQKESRIIDTLEPVMNLHRLVMDEGVIRDNVGLKDRDYSLMYQMTHITRDRGALKHDDRLDSLAGAVSFLQKHMALDVDETAKAMRDAEVDAVLEDFIMGCKLPLGVTRGKLRADGFRAEVYRG